MKKEQKIFIYLLKNSNNDVIYVGQTNNPSRRLSYHKSKYGKFNNMDITMEIIENVNNTYDGYIRETQLQMFYNIETNDRNAKIKNGRKGNIISSNNRKIPIKAINYKTNEYIGVFDSIKDACEKLKVNQSKVSFVLMGKRNHTGGYKFIKL